MPVSWISVTGTGLLVHGRKCTPESPEEPRRRSKTNPIGIAHRTPDRRGLRQHLADQDGTTVDLSQLQPDPAYPAGLHGTVSPAWGGESMSGAEALWSRESMASMATTR